MKDGFSFPGTEFELYGDSFDCFQVAAQHGANDGTRAVYGGATLFSEGGWRDAPASDMNPPLDQVVSRTVEAGARGQFVTNFCLSRTFSTPSTKRSERLRTLPKYLYANFRTAPRIRV